MERRINDRIIHLVTVFSMSLVFCGTHRLNAQVLSLDSVLAMIDRQHPALKEYDERMSAFEEYTKGSSAWMAPMVGAGPFMTPYRSREAMHDSEKGAWMFTLEQDIPNPAKLKANRRYLESRSDIEEQNRKIAYNVLRAEARTAYYRWLVREKKLKVLEESAEVMDLMLALARVRYPFSQGTLGDIYRAEGKLAEIQNRVLMTRSEIEYDRNRLKSLINMPATDSLAIDTATMIMLERSPARYDTAWLSTNRSDIRKIEQTIANLRLNQQVQRLEAKPDFRIRLDHMQPIGNMPRQFSAMAMVSIPIAPWSSRKYKAESRGLSYEIQAMKRRRDAILLEARGQLAGLDAQISGMQQQLENYTSRIIPALRRNHQTLMIAYEENREQLPAVIDAWEALNLIQLEYLDKLEAYYTTIVSYEKALEL